MDKKNSQKLVKKMVALSPSTENSVENQLIAQKLTERGIPKHDIVIGFQKPAVRKFMNGYAIA